MRGKCVGVLFITIWLVTACRTPCNEDGHLEIGEVPDPQHGYDIRYQVYLPPCYDRDADTHYPTLYLIANRFETLDAPSFSSVANDLTRQGAFPPTIIVYPKAVVGFRYDTALVEDLIPYIDQTYRTIDDPKYRGVGGISHAAAISARMAFQAPDRIGNVILMSGGIDPSEQEKFREWIQEADTLPRILIDLGDQDPIISLAQPFMQVLDEEGVSYEFIHDEGKHDWDYWNARTELYFSWVAIAWDK